MKQYIGFDIGGTKCAVILGDETGAVLRREAFATPQGYQATLAQLLAIACPMAPTSTAVGISCGGPLDSKRGIVQSPPNLPGWDDVPIVADVQAALDLPVYLQNDANACALAEWRFGAGMGARNMIFLTFGTGLGAGLILDGKLYTGTSDLAGEVGHMRMSEDGPPGYGKLGSWEGYCSGAGIARQAQALLDTVAEKPSWAHEVSAKTVCQAANAGDQLALQVIRQSAERLGQGLAILIDILNPECIVIGSVYARAEELFRDITWQVVEREALPLAAKVCRVNIAALGDHIGDVAALTVAMGG